MRVLVACEESQEVYKAFRALRHEAYSCDIEPCSGGHPEWHLQVDALELLKLNMFGHPWRKKTCLWLKGLPQLMETDIVVPDGLWVGSTSGRRDGSVYSRYNLKSKRDAKTRAKTFPGIARAMAEQWGGICDG